MYQPVFKGNIFSSDKMINYLVAIYQGSHTLFWDWGLGPLELGKIASFCLKLGKNKNMYFVIHIFVSVNMFKCNCIFIHTVLLETHVWFQVHVLFFSNLSFFLPFFQCFLKESNWENLGSELGKKRYYFALGMGPNIGPKLGRSRALYTISTSQK